MSSDLFDTSSRCATMHDQLLLGNCLPLCAPAISEFLPVDTMLETAIEVRPKRKCAEQTNRRIKSVFEWENMPESSVLFQAIASEIDNEIENEREQARKLLQQSASASQETCNETLHAEYTDTATNSEEDESDEESYESSFVVSDDEIEYNSSMQSDIDEAHDDDTSPCDYLQYPQTENREPSNEIDACIELSPSTEETAHCNASEVQACNNDIIDAPGDDTHNVFKENAFC